MTTTQLVLSVNTATDGTGLADSFRWCWLAADGSTESATSGDREALRDALASLAAPLNAWLILPGSRVNTRELEYTDKEKKHLRNLLPFQLEDSVVGDVEDLHFALGTPNEGKIVVAYADKAWLQALFADLASLGIEVTRCWSAPLTQPLAAEALSEPGQHWTLGLYDGQLHLRYSTTMGFSVAYAQGRLALQLLLAEQQAEQLPQFYLRAATEQDMEALMAMIPAGLQEQVAGQALADHWALDFSNHSIDLCQGDFSQRLPIERWWKLWRSVAIFAAVCTAAYVGTLGYEIHKLGKENLQIRQQIEAAARVAIPQGRMVDPEKQLGAIIKQSQPVSQSSSVMSLLAVALPAIAELPNISIKGISYTAETDELNINIQADSFGTFESLSQKIRAQGLGAELLSANAQGNVQTARLKVSKNP